MEDPSPPRAPKADWRRGMMEASPYLGLGLQLAVSMVFFTGAGYLLDRWLDTLPWLTVVGAGVGMVGLFYQIVRVSNELSRRDRAPRKPGAGSDDTAGPGRG